MKKITLIVLSGILLGLLGAGGYFYYLKVQEKKTLSETPTPSPEKFVIEYTTWNDPLEVSFSYPKDATLNKHDEDKENYMHVEITSATRSGGLTVWAKDLPKGVTDIASWAKKETATSEGVIVDTTLGSVDAKKIRIGNEKVRIATVYDGLLFEIEAFLDTQNYWQEVLETTLSSYVFYPIEGVSPANAGSAGSGNSAGGTIDEEEVLE